MSNKTYTTNKTTGEFECVRCDFKSKTKSEICKHVFDEKKKENRLTQFDLHRINKCGKNSRLCRYCHPEQEIIQKDIDESLKYNLITNTNTNRFDTKIIATLLSLEYRYRHKFNEKHLNQLNTANKRKQGLLKMIRNRIKKRIKVYDKKKDGKQTPYNAHGIDIAMHNLGICCRWCLKRWYKISYLKVLNQETIEQITIFTYNYINDCILNGNNNDSIKQFMTEIKKQNINDMFYKPGNYKIVFNHNGYQLFENNTNSNKKSLKQHNRKRNNKNLLIPSAKRRKIG